MWRDKRLHTNVSDLDATQVLSTLRNLKPKRSIVENEVTYGFIPQDVKIVAPEFIETKCDFLTFIEPLTAKTNNHLIKLDEPCGYLKVNKKVRIRDVGDFKIDEVIDEKHFTVELGDREMPEDIVLTAIQIKDFHTLDKDVVTTMTVSALQEMDREIRDIKNDTLDYNRLKTVNSRIRLIENSIASLIQRIEKIETSSR